MELNRPRRALRWALRCKVRFWWTLDGLLVDGISNLDESQIDEMKLSRTKSRCPSNIQRSLRNFHTIQTHQSQLRPSKKKH